MQFELQLPAQRRRRSLIGLTPLIDVVFILLLFFLLASSFLQWHTIKLSTPKTQGIVQGSSGGAVFIRLKNNGTLDLNGRAVTLQTLPDKLTTFMSANPQQRVLIRPAEGVPLQALVHVLDSVKTTGATNVSLTR